MRLRAALVSVVGVVAAVLAVVPGVAAQAQQAPPGRVGRVTVTAATATSLTLRWPAASGAEEYVVERATDTRMSGRSTVATTARRRLVVTGLPSGSLSCFQVRAVGVTGRGPRSLRSCQYTVGVHGDDRGADYRVLTYNTCAVVCGGWSARRAGAADLIRVRDPDVVMLQETPKRSGIESAIGGYTQVEAWSNKVLLYRTSRFSVARSPLGTDRRGVIELGYDPRQPAHRYAVWAELVDHASADKHVVFVSVHLSPGPDTPQDDAYRRSETQRLLDGLREANPQGLPVVVAGDFNSHQSRVYDSPARLMEDAGYADSYFRAQTWRLPLVNSNTRGLPAPTLGRPWGNHIDQVWADPRVSVVHRWVNGARLVDGRYAGPQPSDHSPVMVDLVID